VPSACRRPRPTGAIADAQLRDAQQTIAGCHHKLARYRAALEAGGDPILVNQWIAEVTSSGWRPSTSCVSFAPPTGKTSTQPRSGRCCSRSVT
jgi:hypothetical protein